MGQTLVRKVLATDGVTLGGGSEHTGHKLAGHEVGGLVGIPTPDVLVTTNPEDLFIHADAVIDFTAPEYSLMLAQLAAKHGKVHVCGTTAIKGESLAAIQAQENKARIIYSSNMSIGVNILQGLVEKVSAILDAEECDIEIDEMHHRFKVDAPSGTALMLGEAAARGRKVALQDVINHYQHGVLGARKQGSIGFSVRRGGDVIGDHTVTFACMGERIEVAHKASSREIYAAGAIRAALWAKDKKPGFYSMKDVLGI